MTQFEECPTCEGTKQFVCVDCGGDGQSQLWRDKCLGCHGTGGVDCPNCHGEGEVEATIHDDELVEQSA